MSRRATQAERRGGGKSAERGRAAPPLIMNQLILRMMDRVAMATDAAITPEHEEDASLPANSMTVAW